MFRHAELATWIQSLGVPIIHTPERTQEQAAIYESMGAVHQPLQFLYVTPEKIAKSKRLLSMCCGGSRGAGGGGDIRA